jgi:ornithine cyclodeaminase/alanine dehydrogenase
LNRAQLRRLLDLPAVVDVVERAFGEYSRGRARMPVRSSVQLDHPDLTLLAMPCGLLDSRALGTKVLANAAGNPARGLPTVQAVYILSDFETGAPLALMDGGELTGLRTAAASAVATRYLARRDSHVLGLFGAGIQAEFHLRAMVEVRSIEEVLVWDPDRTRLESFIRRMHRAVPVDVEAGEDAEHVAAESDLIVTATTSGSPVFAGSAVRPGVHINAVGAFTPTTRELDPELIRRARVVVDTYAGALAEAGDLLIPIRAGQISRDHLAAELGEIVNGTRPGRRSEAEITIFESVGAAFQDAATARLAYERARAQGVGTEFRFEA